MKKSKNIVDEEKSLETVLEYVEKEGELTEILENEILYNLGIKGEKLLQILKNNDLFKLRLSERLSIWEIRGTKKSYFIINSSFCECADFVIRVVQSEKRKYCYHILAKIIGERLNLYIEKNITPEEYDEKLKKRVEDQ